MISGQQTPLVSVILATRDRAALLAVSAGSVLAQTFSDFELIIVDDGSTEDVSAAVNALHDPRVVFIRREVNGGVAAARNMGIQAARGEYLAFQDSDDEWLLDKLQQQLDLIRQRPGSGMVLSGLLRVGERHIRKYTPPAPQPGAATTYRDVIGHPITYTQTWLVRTGLVRKAGGFDERLHAWEDWELLIRLARLTEIHASAAPRVISARQPDSLSIGRSRFIDSMAVILEKHALAFAEYPVEHAGLQYLYARLLAADGRLSEARAVLWGAIKTRPGAIKPWLLGMASLFGPRFVQRSLEARKPAGTA